MSTRNIKDAKDLSTNELIYFKGHAQATYMSDGRTVEEAITSSTGGSGGNVEAITYSHEELLDRPVRDAKDLTTGELVYFTGDARYIMANGGILADVLDDIRNSASIYYWDVEPIESVEEAIPEYLVEPLLTKQGIVILNGGVCQLDEENGCYISSTIKNNTIVVTKILLIDTMTYNSIIVEMYPISNGSSSETSIKVNGITKAPSNGVVDLGYINKQLDTSTSSAITLIPNYYHRITSNSLSTLAIRLGNVSNSNIINEYFLEFTTSKTGTTVTLPADVKWMNGVTPTFEADTIYQISIVNNLGTWVKFK